MQRGNVVELVEETDFYKKGKKATFIRDEISNPDNAEIVWDGEEDSFNKYGDVEVVPKILLKLCT